MLRRRWVRGRLAGGVLLLLAGCATDRAHTATPASVHTEDPLLGGTRPAAQGPAPRTLATPTSLNGGEGVRELPPLASASPTSPAALAGGAFKPLPGAGDLRIGNGSAAPAQLQPPTFDGRSSLPTPVSPTTGQSGLPIPLTSSGQPVATPVATNGPVTSFEQGQALLKQMGAKWQDFKMTDGECKFTCAVPNRSNPSQNHVFEARERTALAAIQQVVEQVRREQP